MPVQVTETTNKPTSFVSSPQPNSSKDNREPENHYQIIDQLRDLVPENTVLRPKPLSPTHEKYGDIEDLIAKTFSKKSTPKDDKLHKDINAPRLFTEHGYKPHITGTMHGEGFWNFVLPPVCKNVVVLQNVSDGNNCLHLFFL